MPSSLPRLLLPWIGAALVACSSATPGQPNGDPCADDPVTGASLDAARAALASGATAVPLSAKGCLKYERTVEGQLLTAEKIIEGEVEVFTVRRSAQTATGSGDFDRDGFAEWSYLVTRGATPLADRAERTTASRAGGPIARTTYTWSDADTIHVAVQGDDGKGGLGAAREFDTPRLQGDGSGSRGPAFTTTDCTPAQATLIEQRLREAMDGDPADPSTGGLACLHRLGQQAKEKQLIAAYVRNIAITCTDGDYTGVYDGTGWFDPGGLNSTSLRVNPVNLANRTPSNQRHVLFHEMLHVLGEHDPAVLTSSRVEEIDLIEACASTCWPAMTSKCSCATCLGTDISDPRCAQFLPCKASSYVGTITGKSDLLTGAIDYTAKVRLTQFKEDGSGRFLDMQGTATVTRIFLAGMECTAMPGSGAIGKAKQTSLTLHTGSGAIPPNSYSLAFGFSWDSKWTCRTKDGKEVELVHATGVVFGTLGCDGPHYLPVTDDGHIQGSFTMCNLGAGSHSANWDLVRQ